MLELKIPHLLLLSNRAKALKDKELFRKKRVNLFGIKEVLSQQIWSSKNSKWIVANSVVSDWREKEVINNLSDVRRFKFV